LFEFIESVYSCMLSLSEGGTDFDDCIPEAVMSLHAIAQHHGITLSIARILNEAPSAKPATELSEEEVTYLINKLRAGREIEDTLYTIYEALIKVVEKRALESMAGIEIEAIA